MYIISQAFLTIVFDVFRLYRFIFIRIVAEITKAFITINDLNSSETIKIATINIKITAHREATTTPTIPINISLRTAIAVEAVEAVAAVIINIVVEVARGSKAVGHNKV